ncbi:unnamed protein product [Heligmosomoides polygyrus]|uniref:MULTIHEME_CYTC domain-containing protein n=1 Tax=Heligmosomoides polygyrus TaxID=6339 RepID=A0A183FJS1_HELPZ|nr:unnamed protein product [Heligmosomoides polygyrus]
MSRKGRPSSEHVSSMSRKAGPTCKDISPTSFIRCLGSEEVSLMSQKACPDSDDVSPLSRQGFRIHTTCHRCRAKHVRLAKTRHRRRPPGTWVQKRCHRCSESPVRIQTTCHGCRAKHVRVENTCHRRCSIGVRVKKMCHPCRARGSRFRRRATDVAQSTFALRTHVTDVVQQASGLRRCVTHVTPGVPDSHEVLPVKVGPEWGTGEKGPVMGGPVRKGPVMKTG